MTYIPSRHRRKQTHDQWTECPRTGINDLRAVEEVGGSKPVISGQNVRGQESMTYVLSRHRRKQKPVISRQNVREQESTTYEL